MAVLAPPPPPLPLTVVADFIDVVSADVVVVAVVLFCAEFSVGQCCVATLRNADFH